MGDGRHGLLSARGLTEASLVYAAHVFRLIAPLLLYPVLARRLGLEGFGQYAAGLSLALMVSAVVEYGFCLSGPRDIAQARADQRGRVVGRVLVARLWLAPVGLLLGGLLALSNPVLRGDPGAVAGALALGAAQGSSVLWFFQGVRRPGVAATVEMLGQGAAMIVILCWASASVGGALAAQALGLGGGITAGAVLMVREARPLWPTTREVVVVLRADLALFVSRGLIVAYTGASAFVLAALAGPAQAALYGVADRVVMAATSFLRPLAGLVGPRVSGLMPDDPDAAYRTMRWSLILTPGAAGVGTLVVVLCAPFAVRLLFGAAFAQAAEVLRVLILILPLVAVSQVLGPQLMTPLRMDRAFAVVVGIGCGTTLIAAAALAPTAGAMGMAWARVIGEAAVVAACVICLRGHWTHLTPRLRRNDAAAA
nr:lipopolysaccharide biosynthesis protein [uncultured Brevundimonas sp.]